MNLRYQRTRRALVTLGATAALVAGGLTTGIGPQARRRP